MSEQIFTSEEFLALPINHLEEHKFTLTVDGKVAVRVVGGVGGIGDMQKVVYDTDNSGVVDNAELVNGLSVGTAVPVGALFTDTTYSVGNGGLTEINFTTALNSKLAGIGTGANLVDVIAGTNVTIDKTDPQNPIINASGTGSTTFLALTDTPAIYTGSAGLFLKVNAGETGLEYGSPAGAGDVVGPASAVADRIVTFNGITGKLIKDSGFTILTSVPALAVFTDTTYSVGNGGLTEINFTSALNTLLGNQSGVNTGDQDLSGYSLTTHNHTGVYEPVFTKNTGFNKNLGTTVGTVSEGNHTHSIYSLTSHTHTGVYEPVFTKNTGFNLNLGTAAGTVSEGDHLHTGVYEPVFTKNTGFNKNLGTAAGTVSEGNHTHSIYELLSNKSTSTALGTSNILYPTQNAVKVYVDGAGGGGFTDSCGVYVGTNQTITSGVITTLPFANEDFDSGANFNTSTYRFTAPNTGKYQVNVLCTMNYGHRLMIYINGVQKKDIYSGEAVSGLSSNQIPVILSLTATDYLEVKVQQVSGSSKTVYGGALYTYWSIAQIQ